MPLPRDIVCSKDSALPNLTPSSSARQTALHILHAIDTQQAYTDVALRQALRASHLERRDRAFVTECVYGVVRWQGRIDWLLHRVCRQPLDSLTPWMRNILRLGTYQCLWMDRVPHRAAVHETVQLARRFGHQGTARLANAVLRTLLRQHAGNTLPAAAADPVAHLAVMHSHPRWLVERWLHRYGWDRTRALCEANNRPAGITLRLNPLRATSEELVQRLQLEGCQHITASRWHAEGLIVQGIDRLDTTHSYQAGWFQVQDEGAMFVAPLCDVQAGHRVLDACAAPGGKTTHLAQCMCDRGTIIALDAQAGRLRLLQENLRRLRLASVTPLAADATQSLPLRLTFDRILVDAPCSGLGVLRRHPDIKWRKSAADVRALQAVQRTLLRNLLPCLAPGGMLVYSVCSNEPEETHDVVRHVLADHPHLRLEPIDNPFPAELSQTPATAGTLDITPDQLGTEGVFIARFRHKSSHV